MSSPVAVGQHTGVIGKKHQQGNISPLKGNYCRSVATQPFVLSADSLDACCSPGEKGRAHDLIISLISYDYVS